MVAFSTIDHGILLDYLRGNEMGARFDTVNFFLWVCFHLVFGGGGESSLVQRPYFVGCLRALFSPGYLGKVFHLYSHCELGSHKHLFHKHIKHKMQYH